MWGNNAFTTLTNLLSIKFLILKLLFLILFLLILLLLLLLLLVILNKLIKNLFKTKCTFCFKYHHIL